MKRSLCMVILGGASLCALPVAAQYLPPTASLLLRYDADQNGIVSRDEMLAGVDADYRLADADSNDCIDSDEMRVENDRRLERDGGVASPISDWNLDGCVNMNEFGSSVRSYFDYADQSGDGEVNTAELQGPSMPIALPERLQSQSQEAPPPPAANPSSPLGIPGAYGY